MADARYSRCCETLAEEIIVSQENSVAILSAEKFSRRSEMSRGKTFEGFLRVSVCALGHPLMKDEYLPAIVHPASFLQTQEYPLQVSLARPTQCEKHAGRGNETFLCRSRWRTVQGTGPRIRFLMKWTDGASLGPSVSLLRSRHVPNELLAMRNSG